MGSARSTGPAAAGPGPVSADEIRIANSATYWPVSPLDLVVGVPLVTRLVLGASPVGRAVQAVVVGAYLASALRDWRKRQGIRRIDFRREFGADIDHLVAMPREVREAEVRALAERLNDEFTPARPSRQELAVEVDRSLTSYIASITGQHIRTSVEVREFTLARLAFPFARGVCDIFSGDIAIFEDNGLFEAHILAHEFSHRKGHWKELHAQVLAYLALARSAQPVLRQSALVERVYRNLRVLAGPDDAELNRRVACTGFRPELRQGLYLHHPRPPSGDVSRRLETAMRNLYDARMRLTGQNGLSDYDLGFTNFLYTLETNAAARQNHAPSGP